MMSAHNDKEILLPHHEQQPLCTTRLPYRQGRNLTAVKAYTVTNESNHLLIFGVPSLNLRQEAKALFFKFGKLIQFNISKEHPAEAFTETYHAAYEKIQSARVAKKMLDTKNFYGGSLHVCYAPEFETIDETRSKLLQRQKDVLFRIRNLLKDTVKEIHTHKTPVIVPEVPEVIKLNMGDVNIININDNNSIVSKRKNNKSCAAEKKFRPYFIPNNNKQKNTHNNNVGNISHNTNKQYITEYSNEAAISNNDMSGEIGCKNVNNSNTNENKIEIIDFTSTETETISNIDEGLNYNKFGNETIRKIPVKPVNRIRFNVTSNKNAK